MQGRPLRISGDLSISVPISTVVRIFIPNIDRLAGALLTHSESRGYLAA